MAQPLEWEGDWELLSGFAIQLGSEGGTQSITLIILAGIDLELTVARRGTAVYITAQVGYE